MDLSDVAFDHLPDNKREDVKPKQISWGNKVPFSADLARIMTSTITSIFLEEKHSKPIATYEG